ncbi:hypothetical protein ACSBOB_21060 [Mesorhizobium sp. ASY16-5R]|jgi:hypothetical protein
MHPVRFLFEEIYRDYWGIPRGRKEPARRASEAPGWLRSRLLGRDKARD